MVIGVLIEQFAPVSRHSKIALNFEDVFLHKFDSVTTTSLLLTLILIFAFQGNVILENPLYIVLIAIPLILQTFLIFAIAYIACKPDRKWTGCDVPTLTPCLSWDAFSR